MKKNEENPQNALRKSGTRELFRKIFEASPDGIIISRVTDDKILLVNRSALAIYGFSEEEMLGKTSAELRLLAKPSDRKKVIRALNEQGYLRDYPLTVVKKSGEKRYVSIAIESIDIENEKCILSIVRDVTEKRMAEERYRNTLDSMLEGCAILGFDWTYLYVNDANARHARMKKEDMLGKIIFEVIPGVEKSVFFDAYKRCMLERTPQRIEAGFTFEDGSKAWYEALANPVHEGIFVMSMDITDRKLAEEELKKKEHILELILDHINEGIIVSDAPDGKVLAVSRWGLNHTIGRSVDAVIDLPVEKYLEQWDVRDINTGEKIEPERLPVSRALKGETIQGEEWLMLRPDGSSFITSVNAVPIYNNDRTKVLNTVATWTDMTSRKKAEEQASQRLIELDTILGSIADGVIVYDTDSKIIRMNAAAETILKYPQADLKMSIQDRVKERYGVWSEDGRRLNPEEMPAMRASKYGEKITGTVVRIQGAGGSRWIIVSAAPLIVSGRQTGAVASMSDITEIKKAEEAISKTKEQYEILFNSIEEGFAHYKAIYDENGRLDDILVLDINPTGAKLSGSSREDQVGRQWKRVWTGIEDSLFDIYREVDKTGEFISFEHFSGITNRWYVSNIYKIGVGEFAVTFFDITDRKLAEINLNRTLVELERSNRDLERFASAASHDLQEPIRMMGSYASLLMKRYNGKLDPQADRYLKFMFEGAIRLQILIKDILNYARLRSDKMAFSRVDLNAVLIAVLDDLRNPVAETGAVINYGELPKIVADRKQIIQLFTNLLSNAIKFRRKNTVPEINILAEDRGKEWLFSVKDNGIGIEPEFAKLIFNIFQRLNEREEYPGVGIGLAICKRIVERHEGSIWMESEVGKGSRFYFIIPKKESDV